MKRKNTKTPEQIGLILAEIIETQWEEFHRADKEPRSKYEWGELRKAYAFGFIKAIELISARGKGVKLEVRGLNANQWQALVCQVRPADAAGF